MLPWCAVRAVSVCVKRSFHFFSSRNCQVLHNWLWIARIVTHRVPIQAFHPRKRSSFFTAAPPPLFEIWYPLNAFDEPNPRRQDHGHRQFTLTPLFHKTQAALTTKPRFVYTGKPPIRLNHALLCPIITTEAQVYRISGHQPHIRDERGPGVGSNSSQPPSSQAPVAMTGLTSYSLLRNNTLTSHKTCLSSARLALACRFSGWLLPFMKERPCYASAPV